MHELDSWVTQMESWYQTRKHDQVELLEPLIISAPCQVWGPTITTLQSKAIACWLDACLRVFEINRYDASEKAFQYLQLAYSKLQQVACNPLAESELKNWSMTRIQHLVVLLLEFCNQQSLCNQKSLFKRQHFNSQSSPYNQSTIHDSQTQENWQSQSHQLIEAHVHFMEAHDHDNNVGNDDHGSRHSSQYH